MKVRTKGGIILEDIKIGDIHYEFGYGICIKVEVISLPVRYDEGYCWQSKRLSDGCIVNYGVNEQYTHYGPNLYNYEAYKNCTQL